MSVVNPISKYAQKLLCLVVQQQVMTCVLRALNSLSLQTELLLFPIVTKRPSRFSLQQISWNSSGIGGNKQKKGEKSGEESRRKLVTMRLESPQFKSIFTPELRKLVELFEKYKYELRIAGGAVRDLLMKKEPHDLDFATTATPDQMHELFSKEEIRTLNVKGERHGTVTCRINDCVNFEVTTLRYDLLCDGRRAEVVFTTDWYLDANRRDLTINSMFLGFDGTVYDYFNGIEDLEKRRVAFVGNAATRIQEDFLRILRYFRFYGRIAIEADAHEPETLKAITDNVDGLDGISGERLWVEFRQIVTGNHADSLMRTMEQCGVLSKLGLPPRTNAVEFTKIRHRCQASSIEPHYMTLVAALVQSGSDLEVFFARVKPSNLEKEIARFVAETRSNDGYKEMKQPQKYFQDLILRHAPFAKTIEPIAFTRVFELLKYLGEFEILRTLKKWNAPRFPVNGNILFEKGVKKGPRMREVLQRMFDLWIDCNYEMNADQLIDKIPEIEEQLGPERKKTKGNSLHDNR